MKQINSDFQVGTQIVVFDQIDATYPGGVQVDKTLATTRFAATKVIPAGTVVVPHTNGTYKVINVTLTAPLVADGLGLTAHDVMIDDFPLAAIVMAGTARIDALPDLEKAGVAFLKAALPRISFI